MQKFADYRSVASSSRADEISSVNTHYFRTVLIIALLPVLFVSGDILTSVINDKISLGLILACFSLLPISLPAIVLASKLKKQQDRHNGVPKYVINRLSFIAFSYIIFDVSIRFMSSGSLDNFALDLISPRGAKSWQLETSDINANQFDLLGYSSLLLTSICICYIAYTEFKNDRVTVNLIPLIFITLITITDFNRLQTIVAFIALYAAIRRRFYKMLLLITGLVLLIAQGSIRGGVETYFEGSQDFEIHSLDKSYLGIVPLIDKADLVGGVVDTANILSVSVTYYIPRFLWKEKPAPKNSDWNGLKENWVAAGLFVELMLIFGIIPGILYISLFYTFISYLIFKSKMNGVGSYLAIVSLLVVLLWAPRSFHSFFQFSPLIIFAWVVNIFATRKILL